MIEIVIALVIAMSGWLFGLIQYFIKRKFSKKDELRAMRVDAYSNYLKKCEEISQTYREEMPLGIPDRLLNMAFRGDVERCEIELSKFNLEITGSTKKTVNQILILTQELNALTLVCSDELLHLIEEYKGYLNELPDICSRVGECHEKYLNDADLKDQKNYNPLNFVQKILEGPGAKYANKKKEIDALDKKIQTVMRKEIIGGQS